MYIKMTRKEREAFLYAYNRFCIALRRRGSSKRELLKLIHLEKVCDKITGQTKINFS